MNPLLNVQPTQILCLEHEDIFLYAEVIQVVVQRQQCWVRPLFLKKSQLEAHLNEISTQPEAGAVLYDLRQGADLICPLSLFRIALDTEVIPLLTILDRAKHSLLSDDGNSSSDEDRTTAIESSNVAHQQLQDLIQAVWQARPEVF